MKKQESSDSKVTIYYEGEILYKDLTYDETTEMLDEMASQFYDNNAYDPNKIELEIN
jgi:hypothetical protein